VNELNLILRRIFKGETYTIGHLYSQERGMYKTVDYYICDTMEDKVRELQDKNKDGDFDDKGEGKIKTQTAIPAGRYQITLEQSEHFKRELPYLHEVPGFKGILIHAGNTAEDSAGCILVGENKVKGKVVNSRYWEKILIDDYIIDAIDNGMKVYITIE